MLKEQKFEEAFAKALALFTAGKELVLKCIEYTTGEENDDLGVNIFQQASCILACSRPKNNRVSQLLFELRKAIDFKQISNMINLTHVIISMNGMPEKCKRLFKKGAFITYYY